VIHEVPVRNDRCTRCGTRLDDMDHGDMLTEEMALVDCDWVAPVRCISDYPRLPGMTPPEVGPGREAA